MRQLFKHYFEILQKFFICCIYELVFQLVNWAISLFDHLFSFKYSRHAHSLAENCTIKAIYCPALTADHIQKRRPICIGSEKTSSMNRVIK